MKAISLWQPWASMIASGKKTIETRKWATSYRGDLLICSTRKPVVGNLPLGQALCIVEVCGCLPMISQNGKAACCDYYEGAYAWFLRNLRSIEPFPVKGSQGFFDVELPVEARQGQQAMFGEQ